MGTFEIIIVFSALMALLALVTIGIDWIGKPLKNRRFIPRMYRFDDEKLPVDWYGNTTLESVPPAATPPAGPYVQPAPVVVARVPELADQGVTIAAPPAHLAPVAPPAPDLSPTPAPTPAPIPSIPPAAAATTDSSDASEPSESAFSDLLTAATPISAVAGASSVAGALVPTAHPTAVEWTPSLPLDATVDDRKPSLAIKAERFWMSTADALGDSHFDTDDIERMSSGKAPRRTNPRTGRTEAMQLTGLRQASHAADVRMAWPDESLDPWNAT